VRADGKGSCQLRATVDGVNGLRYLGKATRRNVHDPWSGGRLHLGTTGELQGFAEFQPGTGRSTVARCCSLPVWVGVGLGGLNIWMGATRTVDTGQEEP